MDWWVWGRTGSVLGARCLAVSHNRGSIWRAGESIGMRMVDLSGSPGSARLGGAHSSVRWERTFRYLDLYRVHTQI
jgi:hypothetical protein